MNKLTTTNAGTQISIFDMMDKFIVWSEIIAKSDIIPIHYRNQRSNVLTAIQTAYRMNLDPMMFMLGTYIVHGRLSMYSSFAISLANTSGLWKGGIKYRTTGEGKDLRVTAYAVEKESGEEISFDFGMNQVLAAGYEKKNTTYITNPKLMLRYRAAILLIRTHAPEVLNGMHTVEELQDITPDNILSRAQELSDKIEIKEDFVDVSNQEIPEVKEESPKHEELLRLIEDNGISETIVNKWLDKAGAEKIEDIADNGIINACIDFANKNKPVTQERI